MKNNIFLLVLSFCFLMNTDRLSAQTDPNIPNPQELKHQDSLIKQLNKYGLKIKEYPASDPCLRTGEPPILKDNPYKPADGLGNPTDIYIGDINYPYLGKTGGDINVYWLHGLNGTTESWRVAAQSSQFGALNFPARKLRSIRGLPSSTSNAVQYYSEDGSITNAAGDLETVNNSLVPLTDRTNYDYIIAHSQGGIVGRDWLRNMDKVPGSYQKFANGIVTFGTPHDGARILNNAKPKIGGIDNPNNKVPAFMKEACVSIAGALVKPKVNASFWTRLLISNDMQNTLINNACDVAANSIVPFVIDNYFKGTTEDYYVGSPFLIGKNTSSGHVEGLSEYTLKVPVVQFYGQELQPVLWKFMSSTMSIGHDKLDNQEKVFGYAQDNQLELKVQDMINDFSASSNFESNEADRLNNNEIASYAAAATLLIFQQYILAAVSTAAAIGFSIAKNKAIDNYHAYDKANVWLTNANDYYLTEIVGARVNQTTLNCRVVGDMDCRDLRYNPEGSGVPPVKVKLDYNYNTSNVACNPETTSYADYHFTGHNGLEWHGPCTRFVTVIPTWKNTYYYNPNDGVVLSESASKQINVDITLPGVTWKSVIMPETNHDQMKNCERTRLGLIDLYDGVHGRFFKVDLR